MSTINNHVPSLENVSGLQELSAEQAATIQGGVVILLRHHNRSSNAIDRDNEVLGRFHGGGLRRLSRRADNQISSIWISPGQVWKFFLRPNWVDLPGRDSFVLDSRNWRRGRFVNLTWSNDKISSFRRLG